ncbi:hypothetical protein RUMOBE_03798 [Blautia obeum ATCC 29174]|uniref:Uncharacterized protein n=1 Tax=Blautia obeum ATCC 29174 TaxID=411459 RepID=A5ZXP3_9FIRM|nr:hypothetical protein RUMOBE_03798 [Blautia obeum ATCC 29174]
MKIIDNSSFLCDSKKILKKLQKNFIFYRKWYFFLFFLYRGENN